MAAAKNDVSVRPLGGRRRKGSIPVKRVINLAEVDKKTIDLRIAIPAILLVLAAAFLFSKFAVADRLIAVNRAEGEVAAAQRELDAAYQRLDSFGELTELYAHYTYSGFTYEELNRADRVDVLELIRSTVIPYAKISSWTITGNELTIFLSAESLQQINLIVQQLESKDMVDFCMVNTANTNDNTRGNATKAEFSIVRGRIIAYLNAGMEVDRG